MGNSDIISNEHDISNEQETVPVLNTFFFNIGPSLKIPEYTKCDPTFNNISSPIFKSILKYRNHPSILAIEEVSNRTKSFLFNF